MTATAKPRVCRSLFAGVLLLCLEAVVYSGPVAFERSVVDAGDLDIVSAAWDAWSYLHLWRNDSRKGKQP